MELGTPVPGWTLPPRPALDAAFRQWLTPSNFDADRRQRTALGTLTSPILVSRG